MFGGFIDDFAEPVLDALLASWRYAFTFTVLRMAAIGGLIVLAAIALDRLDETKHVMLFNALLLMPLVLVVMPFGVVYFVRNVGRFVRAARREHRGEVVESQDIPRHPRGVVAPSLNEVWPHSDGDDIWKRAASDVDATVDNVGLSFGLPAVLIVVGLMLAFAFGLVAVAVSIAIAAVMAYLGRRRVNRVRAESCRRLVDDWKASRRSPARG